MHPRFSLCGPIGRSLPTDAVTYGPDIPGEDELRLLGNVEGRRLLDLGCGSGSNAVALARRGARVIGLDEHADHLADAREAGDEAEVRIELHQGPLAELAFLRADTIDAALSVFGLASVVDIDRVFRQVHRVLRSEAAFVICLPHPAAAMVDPQGGLAIERSYWDDSPIPRGADAPPDVPRTIAQLFTSLTRANFRIDTLLEPPPHGPDRSDAMRLVPATVIVRARKEGS